MSSFSPRPDIRAKGDPKLGEYAPIKTQCFFCLEVRESSMGSRVGKGVFAKEGIPAASVIFIGGGQLSSDISKYTHEKDYSGIFDERYIIAPINIDSPTDNWFINHSCDPNTKIIGRLVIVAKRDISSGMELTVDYAAVAAGDISWSMQCGCGSPACRNIITNEDWKNPDLFNELYEELPSFIQQRGINKGWK